MRRVCCDAEIIPVVLRGDSELLDVGRSKRLVTPAIRTALIARDGGCVFPTCVAPPSACEAHHVVPWQRGGRTRLDDLILVCHHYHAVVEPDRYRLRDQWQVRISSVDKLPEFAPPARHPQAGEWLRHARHRMPSEQQPDPAGPQSRPAAKPAHRPPRRLVEPGQAKPSQARG